ncbi:MAG: VWA domain-containing protein [Gemmatimonadota bacterium]
MSAGLPWIAAAALAAAGLAAWTYLLREEPVPGRLGPAVARGVALFLLMAGPVLPGRRAPGGSDSGTVALLDISRSMTLPASRAGSISRIDSARALLAALRPDRVLLFGDGAEAANGDGLAVPPTAGRSRVTPALEAARLSGADSVWVLTDGEWDDRELAAETAQRMGLGVRELRVAAPESRVGLTEVEAPLRVTEGDTVRVAVGLAAGGAGLDSVTVEVREAGIPLRRIRVAAPGAGRRAQVRLGFLPRRASAGWRDYEVALAEGADPYGAADRRRFALEVTPAARAAVLISTDPGWESRFLLPILRRSVLGGASGYLLVAPDRFLELGARPRAVEGRVPARASESARLLVVEGRPGSLPAWVAERVRTHPRLLLLPRGAGPVPGTPLSLGSPLVGEWYPAGPVPPGPTARLLAGLPLDRLPPLLVLRPVEGPLEGVDPARGGVGDSERWIPLAGRRNRRGESRPLWVAGRTGERRWAVGPGEGYWRWVLRGGARRRAYEAVVAGLTGWLLEESSRRPVEPEGGPWAGEPLRWRIAPTVREARIAVRDSAGNELWSGRRGPGGGGASDTVLNGPSLPAGLFSFVARGTGSEGPFTYARPFVVSERARELSPKREAEPLSVAGVSRPRSPRTGRSLPVWPFLAAAVTLCGEWAWRRRIGLR